MADDFDLTPLGDSLPQDGFAFGATPKLTTTLKRLVRSYPKGVGIIKEFLQNADDAGARSVRIIMDWRSHPSESLPSPKMRVLTGPALLIYNDTVFSDEDLENIQNIGESIKQTDTSKIGRFGLGFNATYNVTDYPSLLTRHYILFFDPHLSVIPGANLQHPGRGWDLQKRYVGGKPWGIHPDMLSAFQIPGLGFSKDQEFFPGTLFRLPLRTEEAAQQSQIKNEAFTHDDFDFIVKQLKQTGAELMLFLKNVTHCSVYEIGPESQEPNLLLSIATQNEPEVLEKRQQISQAIGQKAKELLERLKAGDNQLPKVAYHHHIEVKYEAYSEYQDWCIAAGLYTDGAGEMLKITEIMVNQGEKAFPWAGCAARIKTERNGELVENPSGGQLYCLLPLEIPSALPVHLNGLFDLDESRKMLTTGELRGGDENRVRWNELLVRICVARAYSDLIQHLAIEMDPNDVKGYYSFSATAKLAYKVLKVCDERLPPIDVPIP